MSRRTLLVLVSAGLGLSLLGIVLIVVAGGWSATGIGTPHSGTPLAVFGAMGAMGGLVLLFATVVAAFLVRLNPPR